MDAENTVELKPILEGKEGAIEDVSQYFTSLGIKNSVSLVEDCQPGT